MTKYLFIFVLMIMLTSQILYADIGNINLVIDKVSFSSLHPKAGSILTVQIMVKNNGTMVSPEGILLDLYQNLKVPPQMRQMGDYFWELPAISGGGEYKVEFQLIEYGAQVWNSYLQLDSEREVLLPEQASVAGPCLIKWIDREQYQDVERFRSEQQRESGVRNNLPTTWE